MKRTILSTVLASLLVLSGCGGGEEDEAKTAISDYLMEQQDDAQMITLKEGEADFLHKARLVRRYGAGVVVTSNTVTDNGYDGIDVDGPRSFGAECFGRGSVENPTHQRRGDHRPLPALGRGHPRGAAAGSASWPRSG